MISRRALFGGLAALAAPAIIRTPGLLMPVLISPEARAQRAIDREIAEYYAMIQDRLRESLMAAMEINGPLYNSDQGFSVLRDAAYAVLRKLPGPISTLVSLNYDVCPLTGFQTVQTIVRIRPTTREDTAAALRGFLA